jgi:hypothetical protein
MAEPGEFFMAEPLEVQLGGATVFVVPVDRSKEYEAKPGWFCLRASGGEDGTY